MIQTGIFHLFQIQHSSGTVAFLLDMPEPEMSQPDLLAVQEFKHRGIGVLRDDFCRDGLGILSPDGQILESGQFQFMIDPVQPRRTDGIPGEVVNHRVRKGSPQPGRQVVLARCQDDFRMVTKSLHHFPYIVDQDSSPGPQRRWGHHHDQQQGQKGTSQQPRPFRLAKLFHHLSPPRIPCL